MARLVLLAFLVLGFVSQLQAYPVGFLRRLSGNSSSKSDGSWLWSWAWGADSQVSIVDRSPPLTFASRPAAFGAEITDPLLGYVIPLSSFTESCATNISNVLLSSNVGCPTLCVSGPHEPERSESWIALVQRGECPFVQKVREAQRLGAKAVVVGGNDPDKSGYPDTLVNMYSQEDSSDINIPSTFIKYSDYVVLSSLITVSNTSHSGLQTLSLLISTDYSGWEWYSPILTFIIILFLPSSLTFITLIIHRIRAVRAAQRDRAPEEMVKNLPSRVWTGSGWEKHGDSVPQSAAPSPPPDIDLEEGPNPDQPSTSRPDELIEEPPWFENQSECAICLSEFEKGDRVRVLPCQHVFHIEEVDEWLIHRKKLCPVCKADVTQPHLRLQNDVSPDELNSPRSPSRNQSPATERTPLLRNDSSADDSGTRP